MEQIYSVREHRRWAGTSTLLVLRAISELLWIDLLLLRGFPRLYQAVRSFPRRSGNPDSACRREICHAVDLACVFYFKRVRCLQRSAAATRLLRHAGIAAEMVIGIQPCPFRAHAWVEVAGSVVTDKPYVAALYAVMDRC